MKISNTIAGVATLALAAIPMLALGSNAFAAQPVTVQVADLDVSTPAGAREFERRTNAAASEFCGPGMRLSEHVACKAAVRAEVTEKLIAMKSAPTAYAAR